MPDIIDFWDEYHKMGGCCAQGGSPNCMIEEESPKWDHLTEQIKTDLEEFDGGWSWPKMTEKYGVINSAERWYLVQKVLIQIMGTNHETTTPKQRRIFK